jgi:hypothetical protein
MDAGTIATVVAAGVAVISAVVAIVQTSAAKDQAAAALESATAAEAQAQEAERSADAAEQQVVIAREQLEQSRVEWSEQRMQVVRTAVHVFIDSAKAWHDVGTALFAHYSTSSASDPGRGADLIRDFYRAIRTLEAAIAATLPYAATLPFGRRISEIARLVGGTAPLTDLVRASRTSPPTAVAVAAATAVLDEMTRQTDAVHQDSARWLIAGSTPPATGGGSP